MGEEGVGGGDPQRIKRIAAAAYEYENDRRWAEYWNNVLIPPHLASRSDVVDHFKRKFYQRFIDPDLVVEAMTSTSSSQSARASSRSTAAPATESARSRTTASNTGTQPPRGNSNALRLDKQTIHFSTNAWVLVVAMLGVLPVVPITLSNKAYKLSLMGMALSSFYSLYTLYGKPRAWSLPAIQTWFQSIFATKDFIHFVYCLMLVSSQMHFKFALVPVLCWALEHVAKFLRMNFNRSMFYRKYLGLPCVWVESNINTLNILSSNAEIALGFLLILSLISWQRNILQTFMYWQLLKLMYHAPATAGYHQSVWARINRTISPYIHTHAPFLKTPLSAIQRWWIR